MLVILAVAVEQIRRDDDDVLNSLFSPLLLNRLSYGT